MKFGLVDPEIILSEMFILKIETTGCTSLPIYLELRSYRTKVTHDVARSSQMNFFNITMAILQFVSECHVRLRLKVNSPILQILTQNWLPWQSPLSHRKKRSDR